MKELQELRDEILTLRNYGVINKEEEKSLLTKLNSLKEQLTIGGVVRSKRKSNTELFNKMNNDFMQAIIDSDNGIYDPIEEFGKELEDKYIIIEK